MLKPNYFKKQMSSLTIYEQGWFGRGLLSASPCFQIYYLNNPVWSILTKSSKILEDLVVQVFQGEIDPTTHAIPNLINIRQMSWQTHNLNHGQYVSVTSEVTLCQHKFNAMLLLLNRKTSRILEQDRKW